jgi:hypothetical protein
MKALAKMYQMAAGRVRIMTNVGIAKSEERIPLERKSKIVFISRELHSLG